MTRKTKTRAEAVDVEGDQAAGVETPVVEASEARVEADSVRVEIDEAAIKQRKEDTERYMADPQVIAEMEEGRLALEAELAARAQRDAEEPAEQPTEGEPMQASPATEDDGGPIDWENLKQLEKPSVEAGPVWTAKGQRAYRPENLDDPFSVGRVVYVEVRLYRLREQYRLVIGEDGVEDQVWEGPERDGWGAALARRDVRIDAEADYGPLHALPRVHPGEIERQKRVAERFQRQMGNYGARRGREHFQDRDLVTGQVIGWSDGVNSWADRDLWH